MKFVVTGIQVYVVASRMNPTITRSNLVLVFHKNISHVGTPIRGVGCRKRLHWGGPSIETAKPRPCVTAGVAR